MTEDDQSKNTTEDQQPESEAGAGAKMAEGIPSKPEHPDAEQPETTAQADDPAADPVAEAGGTEADDGLSADDAASMAESLLAQVTAAVSDVNTQVDGDAVGDTSQSPGSSAPPAAPPQGSEPIILPSFDAQIPTAMPSELDLLADVNLNVKIELGRTRLLVDDVLKLTDGAVVELDKLAGDPVDIYVNERHIARGEVLVLNDNFCIRINEIIDPESRQVG